MPNSEPCCENHCAKCADLNEIPCCADCSDLPPRPRIKRGIYLGQSYDPETPIAPDALERARGVILA